MCDRSPTSDRRCRKIVNSLKEGAAPYCFTKSKKFTPVPGWNEYCKQLHARARDSFLLWVRNGKIRYGVLFEEMKAKRRDFINALNYCKTNRNEIIDRKIASNFKNKKMKDFWKCVSKKKNVYDNKVTETIDGFENAADIAGVFAGKFSAITGNVGRGNLPDNFRPNTSYTARISSGKVVEAIGLLKTGIGFDGIHSNHFKFISNFSILYLTRFINACFIHNYFPRSILAGVVTPIVKNKSSSLSCSQNYREVMISSNFLKLIEYILLPVLKNFTRVSPYQFGYREKASTILASALLKETINAYSAANNSVYSCFIDLSKAFERINHRILFTKLRNKGVPEFLIEILSSIFSQSVVSVHWQGIFSKEWNVSKGARQGGVLSALLFVLYFDDILTEISNMSYGCRLGLAKMNVLAYADDVVLSAPSLAGLQQMLNKFMVLIKEHEFVVNVDKTCFMIFNNKLKVDCSPLLNIDDKNLNRVFSFKYLGCILTENMCEASDMEKCMAAFNKSFGVLFRKFYSLDIEPFFSLFQSFCTSFYGAELWVNRLRANANFKKLSVSYHAALKKILGFPKYFSNHLVCAILNTFTFEHFVNFKCLMFFKRLISNDSPCFMRVKNYFMEKSYFKENLESIFSCKYNVRDILDNDTDAILSRVLYIQNREPSSMYVPAAVFMNDL